MENNIIDQFLSEVKKNKKYNTILDEAVLNEIKSYLRKNPEIDSVNKQSIKEIRAKLHLSYSSFQTKKKNKIQNYLNELKNRINSNKDVIEITNKLLSSSLSAKERINDYLEIYEKIFKITGKPNSILDLGCGLNPFSFPFMNVEKLNYYAYDINEKDIDYLNEYFETMKQKELNGKAKILDIRKKESLSNLPDCDIIFLWKIIDIIDKDNHKPSEELIKQLIKKTNFIVASFATRTITRKPMNYPKRKWFEIMLNRNKLKFCSFQTENEIFYVIH